MNEDKSTRYHRLKRRADVLAVMWSGALLAGLLLTGGTALLREAARSLAAGLGPPPALVPAATVSAYVLLLSALHELVALPLGFYQGFLLERRYGLATETAGRWLRDHLKAGAIALAFGLLGSNLVYFVLARWPDWWWAIAASAFSFATIVFANLAPILLLPLFYRFTPLERESLRARLVALAERAGARVVGAYEWRVSDRTRKANAALTGLGRTRRIIVSDTLLAEYSDDEIEVILAHELAHHVHRDIWKGIAYETALTFAAFCLAQRALVAFAPAIGLEGPADPAGLPLLLLAGGALSLVVLPAVNAISRAHERRADRYALRLTGNVAAFVSAMRRLSAQNLAEDNPSLIARLLYYTHPPIRERIAAARAWPAEHA
jgi:STE24 endopeptidase